MDVEDRIDRMESREEIRQLALKYALSADMKDLDALAGLFVEDVQVSPTIVGREMLRREFEKGLKNFKSTMHLVGNHLIEFEGRDTAKGNVYCRAEHDLGDYWVIVQLMYHDDYVRRDGRWLFARRRSPLYWYAADLREPPLGEHKVRWPGRDPFDASMHLYAPSWAAAPSIGEPTHDVPTPVRMDEFIDHIRAGAELPKPQYMTKPPR